MSFTGNLKADIRFKYEIDRVIATLNVSSVRYVRQGGDGGCIDTEALLRWNILNLLYGGINDDLHALRCLFKRYKESRDNELRYERHELAMDIDKLLNKLLENTEYK